MMQQRRGITTEALVALVLAVFLLVFAALGFYRLMSGHWPVNFIPSFNQSSSAKSELALVRYVIPDDRVDYYDGAKWRSFGEAKRELAGRVYDGGMLKKVIWDAYVDTQGERRSAAEPVELFDGYYARIRTVQPYDSGWSQRGDVLVELWKHSSDGGAGQLYESYGIHGASGELKMLGRGERFLEKNGVAREEVRRKALAWREQVLQRPVGVSVEDASGLREAYVCLSRTPGSNDLVADLKKEVQADMVCGRET